MCQRGWGWGRLGQMGPIPAGPHGSRLLPREGTQQTLQKRGEDLFRAAQPGSALEPHIHRYTAEKSQGGKSFAGSKDELRVGVLLTSFLALHRSVSPREGGETRDGGWGGWKTKSRGGDAFCSQRDQKAAAQGRAAPRTPPAALQLPRRSCQSSACSSASRGTTMEKGPRALRQQAGRSSTWSISWRLQAGGSTKGSTAQEPQKRGKKPPPAIKHKTRRRAGRGRGPPLWLEAGRRGLS